MNRGDVSLRPSGYRDRRGSWRCEAHVEDVEGQAVGNPPACLRCGSDLPHPLEVCKGCEHLVVFHGRDTEGCGRIFAGGWCTCRRAFGRELAEYVRYA